jgi:hypothetical protein
VSSLERYSLTSGIIGTTGNTLFGECNWCPAAEVSFPEENWPLAWLAVCVGMMVFSSSSNDPIASCLIRIERRKRVSADLSNQKRERNFARGAYYSSSYLRFHSAKFKVRELEKSREKNLHPHRPSSGTLRPDDFHRLRLHRLHGAGDDVALRWLFTRRHGWLKVSIEHPPILN